MKFIKKLLLKIYVTINPVYWLQNHPTSAAWDYHLNKMLDNPKFEYMSHHRISLNGTHIWIANYPYAFGSKCIKSGWSFDILNLLPYRTTRFRLKKAVDEFLVNYQEKQFG